MHDIFSVGVFMESFEGTEPDFLDVLNAVAERTLKSASNSLHDCLLTEGDLASSANRNRTLGRYCRYMMSVYHLITFSSVFDSSPFQL